MSDSSRLNSVRKPVIPDSIRYAEFLFSLRFDPLFRLVYLTRMDQQNPGRKIMKFCLLAVLGIGYSGWLYSQHALTGMDNVDGMIGVVLGLYICSHPAATLVDILFYKRWMRYQFSSVRSVLFWLALNMLILFIGGVAIFVGTTCLIGSPTSG